ncbi:MAG: DUF2202 domain-containing protein [Xanthomonadales bacterium]|nr:DUF2202 domain-containing protein [Xanthomonadales bacterium]
MKKLISSLVIAMSLLVFTVANAAIQDDSFIQATLSEAESTNLVFMREEEKLARDTYITLYETWGSRVFSNISSSEQNHMDVMLTMLNIYGIPDPVPSDTVGDFNNTILSDLYIDLVAKGNVSWLDAMYVGAFIEEVDIRDIEVAIDQTVHADLIAAYENLLAGSKNHLRAFVSQIEGTGIDYVAQVLDQSEVDAILGKPVLNEFVINPGLNDAWYYPETNGQGFFITVFPNLETVSLAWFTYDTERPAEGVEANLGDAGHRWLTAIGPYSGNEALLEISITVGGLFDSTEPVPESTPGGTIQLHFDDCSSGTVSYDIPSINQVGLIPIQRVAADNVALCEALIGSTN